MTFEEYLRDLPHIHTWDGGATWNTGGFVDHQLRRIHDFLSANLPESPTLLETGAGNSTICFLFLNPRRLISIAPSSDLFDRIASFCSAGGISRDALDARVEGSEWALPVLAAANRTEAPFLDFALIDGLHNWPTVFVDFFYVNWMLRPGGYVMIDDVQLHSVKELARLLTRQPGFELVLDIGKSLIFRKTNQARHLPEWTNQPYIFERSQAYAAWPNQFALDPAPDGGQESGTNADLAAAQAENAVLHRNLTAVTDERDRLSRQLSAMAGSTTWQVARKLHQRLESRPWLRQLLRRGIGRF